MSYTPPQPPPPPGGQPPQPNPQPYYPPLRDTPVAPPQAPVPPAPPTQVWTGGPVPPPAAPLPPTQQVPPAAPGAPNAGLLDDPSTLAATGLLAAVVFAVFAGLIAFLGHPLAGGAFRGRLLNLTETVDVGDVALLGVAVALLLLTPDPPGGIKRTLLLQVSAGLAAIITVYGLIRALVLLTIDTGAIFKLSGFISTVGVALAAATVAFYAAKESFLKPQGRI